ncbi:hypothetical protein CCR75_002867 [Bremia lactucae]|uniref:Secreted protein n=1 Tax=Bremia lactucae TaxID=4779 RepID=A0A976FLW1_BRELC|nr:hypothetical protein CCR75_002867 [Bremia lactucae]
MHLIRTVLFVAAAFVAIADCKSFKGTDLDESSQQATNANLPIEIEERRGRGGGGGKGRGTRGGREAYRANGIGMFTPFMYSSETPHLDRERDRFYRHMFAKYVKMKKDNQAA